MATADIVKTLIHSHLIGDEDQFRASAMQIAANEARQGNTKIANAIRDLIKQPRTATQPGQRSLTPSLPDEELRGVLVASRPEARLVQMVLSSHLRERLERILHEYRERRALHLKGLCPRRKILLAGPPGTGKTLTASVIAGELKLPLYSLLIDGLISKYMGETAARLRKVFDAMQSNVGVYLVDECDAIGGQRGLGNDVGESRRVLNAFLQMVEQDRSDSIIIAVSNHVQILDHALFRRFDDVLEYEMPSPEQGVEAIKFRLAMFKFEKVEWREILCLVENLSLADVTRAAENAAKAAIMENSKFIRHNHVVDALTEQQRARIAWQRKTP